MVSCIPYEDSISEGQDNQSIVHLPPVKEVQASHWVSKKVDPPYGGAGSIGYDIDVVVPR